MWASKLPDFNLKLKTQHSHFVTGHTGSPSALTPETSSSLWEAGALTLTARGQLTSSAVSPGFMAVWVGVCLKRFSADRLEAVIPCHSAFATLSH